MYSRPSTSRSREAFADATKRGDPPTCDHARTGELTPPEITRRARANNISEVWPVLCMKCVNLRARGADTTRNRRVKSRYLATLEICETKLLQRSTRNTTHRASTHIAIRAKRDTRNSSRHAR